MIDWDAFKTQMQSNPKKMLGFVLGIAVCFLLIWMLVVLQTDSSSKTVTVDKTGRLDSLRIALNRTASDSLTNTSARESKGVAKPERTKPSPFANALPTFLILLAAIGGLWYWIKKRSNPSASRTISTDELFTVIGGSDVTVGNQITIIKINNEFWVMSTGSGGMNLLHRYAEDEWTGPDGSEAKEQGSTQNLFAGILKKKQEQ